MGYTTEFKGTFTLDRPLTQEHANYLNKFNQTRRMLRDSNLAEMLPDPTRLAVNLPIGNDGEYFTGGSESNDIKDKSILNHNAPPKSQPGLWCEWIPTDTNDGIQWSDMEKFYHYVEWIEYIIKHFLQRWNYILNGSVTWKGEDKKDRGEIVIKDNVVEIKADKKMLQKREKEQKQYEQIMNRLVSNLQDGVILGKTN